MKHDNSVEIAAPLENDNSTFPANFINCYDIVNSSMLAWPVSTYSFRRIDNKPQAHEERGFIKNSFWTLRKQYPKHCSGFGFVIDVDDRTVAVPASWKLPSPITINEYEVTFEKSFDTNYKDPRHTNIIAGIVREGLKNHFKENRSKKLGFLWQDYNHFCQMPDESTNEEFLFCRRFGISAKKLRGNRWVIKFLIGTATLDGKSIGDYYRKGAVEKLAAMIDAKRANRLTRSGQATAIRVWRNESTPFQTKARVYELEEPGVVLGHATLSNKDQQSLVTGSVSCRVFGGKSVDIPVKELRLILDSQITQEEHGDTIIAPGERADLMQDLRDFLDGSNLYDHTFRLSNSPVNADDFSTILVAPPPIRVKDENGSEKLIESPRNVSESSLSTRCRARLEHIRQFGFLYRRPINPLLACPARMSEKRAHRMRSDLEYIWQLQGIDYRFGIMIYRDVEDIRKEVEHKGYDTLLAVLPEGSLVPHTVDSMHEKIKRRIAVPSQCIKHDRTLPEAWVERRPRDFKQAEPKLQRRIQQNYQLCLLNLLVKHNWVPFAPAEAFHYNVHVGLDVGGRNNNKAMACLGYGFENPLEGLTFLPEEISIDSQKAEPIPTESLYQGLLQLFEYIHKEYTSVDIQPNFERTIFYRDGQLLGAGDNWNESEALSRLHNILLRRQWIKPDSVWTAVEILKEAEGWRLMRNSGRVVNPLIGQCVFLFEEDNVGLISTTGAPYLTQGTASPLVFRIRDIHGSFERSEVVRDLIWQADMCFTKPDMGMRLPWVLHVADTGALHLSRSYRISGITV